MHHIVKSVAADRQALPPDGTVLGVLPTTIDTPSNRAAMPSADTTAWTPIDHFSATLYEWAEQPASRPPNGSLVVFRTQAGKTTHDIR